MNTASKLIAISMAVFAITAQTAQAKTAAELKTTIENYGLSAAVTSDDIWGNTVTVTGTKTGATSSLDLNIDGGVQVIWRAELTGKVGDGGSIGPGPLEPPFYCLVCISGTGVLNVQSGVIRNNGVGGIAIENKSTGTVNINGGTVDAVDGTTLNTAVNNRSGGVLNLSGTPAIAGRFLVFKDNPISVDAAFAPGEKIYELYYNGYTAGMILVKGGGNFPSNFSFTENRTGLIPVASGNDLVLSDGSSSSFVPSSSSNAPSSSSTTPSSSSSSKPSSSSNAPSSSSISPSSSSSGTTPIFYNRENPKIGIQAKGMYITLENLPKNAKVEIYNLQGKQIHSSHSVNSQILKIPVQTKGMYIIKIGSASILKVPVM